MAIGDYRDALAAQWRIFPIHPMTFADGIGKCTCDNPRCDPKAAGKHPRMSHWQYAPEWSASQLAFLEDEEDLYLGNQFDGHYGIVVNASGLLVVDVDGRNGGFESAKKLQDIRDACGYIVATGSGDGEHWYFSHQAEEGGPGLVGGLKDFPGLDFKSTGYVVGDGSLHRFNNHYYGLKGSPSTVTPTPQRLLDLLQRQPAQHTATSGKEVDLEELPGLIEAIPNNARNYDLWLSVGMALHDATQGSDAGYALWVQWSAKNQAHDESIMDMKWHSFGKIRSQKITVGTLYAMAQEHGYTRPVTFTDNTDWGEVEAPATPAAAPLVVTDDAIPQPHGLVGELAAWINSRSIYPRENLALAAALHIVSNAAGLRYRVAPLNTTLNLLTIGTAASRTGKGAILECVKRAHAAMGVTRAMVGDFKSKQDLIRNAIDNQAIYYVLDEMGGFFAKTSNASRSGAHYLEDLLETIMQMYTEGNSYHLVNGDLKRAMLEQVDRESMRLKKDIDAGKIPADTPLLAQAKAKRIAAQTGIKNPCLSLFAVGEPSKFNETILKDPWLLVGGFLGRTLIFEEHETVPDKKPDHEISQGDLPINVQTQLQRLFWDGYSDTEDARLELVGGIKLLHLTTEAQELKSQIEMFWRQIALKERDEGSNLESQALGATEQVLKVAGIMGAANGEISRQDIAWAQSLVRKITLGKIARAKSGEKLSSGNSKERGDGLLIGLITALRASRGEGLTLGRLRNKVSRKTPSDTIQQALEHLCNAGHAKTETKTGGNGKTTTLYHIA